MSKSKEKSSNSTSVLSIRIEKELDAILTKLVNENKKITKANIIRIYLELAKYIVLSSDSITSYNKNDLIILKKNFFKDIIEKLDEARHIEIGTELGKYINDLARVQGKVDDIECKLELCQHMGLFKRYIDEENYIMISKSFGPKRFVEAFVWQFITKGDKGDFDKSYNEAEMANNKKLRAKYEDQIKPVRRDEEHYAFEFAKVPLRESK